MPRLFFKSRLWFLLCLLTTMALFWLVVSVSPQNAPVMVYKVVLMLAGGVAGYLLDRALFRYADPSSYLELDWRTEPDRDGGDCEPDFPILCDYKGVFIAAMARQAAIIITGMLAVGLGL